MPVYFNMLRERSLFMAGGGGCGGGGAWTRRVRVKISGPNVVGGGGGGHFFFSILF